MRLAFRLALLLGSVGAGAVVGLVGSSLSGNAAWYLAIPVAVAVGWLFVANPLECQPPAAEEARDRQLPG